MKLFDAHYSSSKDPNAGLRELMEGIAAGVITVAEGDTFVIFRGFAGYEEYEAIERCLKTIPECCGSVIPLKQSKETQLGGVGRCPGDPCNWRIYCIIGLMFDAQLSLFNTHY